MRTMCQVLILAYLLVSLTLANPPLTPPRPTQSKYITQYVVDRNTLLLRRKIFIFRNELYSPWSEWGNCSTKDCTELRFRRCLNDSYENWIPNLFKTNHCPFQYIAETRRCQNDTGCRKDCESHSLSVTINYCSIIKIEKKKYFLGEISR